MDLIEDALKATRTLHRLIMTVSLVTLVFALSLDLPREKVYLRDRIDALLELDFLAYEDFVAEKVEAFRIKTLEPIGAEWRDLFKDSGFLVLNLHHIGDGFAQPIHIGKLLTDKLVLADIENATLAQLEALNGLGLDQNVQVVVPRTDSLKTPILEFLGNEARTGQRLDELRISLDLPELIGTSRLPGQDAVAGIYFELVREVLSGAAPVFNASFYVDIVELPDTSFMAWVAHTPSIGAILPIDDQGEVNFLHGLYDPSSLELSNLPAGDKTRPLGEVRSRLHEEITGAGPDRQAVSFLGTEVPGYLVAIAAPLTLLVLAYYFANHTSHLRRVVLDQSTDVSSFAWMPIAMRAGIRKTGSFAHWWALETVGTVILLPIAALCVLYFQLFEFSAINPWSGGLGFTAALGVGLFGLKSLSQIQAIRG